jgi:hypothetical protein
MAEVKLFTVYNELKNLIQTNITNPSGETKWIFPTFATNDSNLPQITIKILNPVYEDDSAGSFLYEEDSTITEIVDDEEVEIVVHNEYYYKKATLPVNIYILTGKQQEYNIDGLFYTNQPLNIQLTNQIKELLWIAQENNGTFKDKISRVKVLGIDFAFRDNANTWASEIQVEASYKDKWLKQYRDGELVSEYSLTLNTTLEED